MPHDKPVSRPSRSARAPANAGAYCIQPPGEPAWVYASFAAPAVAALVSNPWLSTVLIAGRANRSIWAPSAGAAGMMLPLPASLPWPPSVLPLRLSPQLAIVASEKRMIESLVMVISFSSLRRVGAAPHAQEVVGVMKEQRFVRLDNDRHHVEVREAVALIRRTRSHCGHRGRAEKRLCGSRLRGGL